MILDGNSFSSRLPKFLSSGSLLFRAGLFTEWFDERIRPWSHFLPVRRPFVHHCRRVGNDISRPQRRFWTVD